MGLKDPVSGVETVLLLEATRSRRFRRGFFCTSRHALPSSPRMRRGLRAGATVTQDLWHMCCLVVTKTWHWSRSRKDKLFISDALDQVINAQACVEALDFSRSIWCRNSGTLNGFLSKFHWRSLEHHAMPRVPLSTVAGSKFAVLWGSSSLANAGVLEALTATGRACWNVETDMIQEDSKRGDAWWMACIGMFCNGLD
jgi:hypothetical protein